ncbi:MAG: MotA/TolQ/ExbB proton channel family protein [Phycisphaerales bacterium]
MLQVIAAAPSGGASAAGAMSIWEFILKGGVMMIPIGICSLVALAVVVERLMVLSRPRVLPSGLTKKVDDALDEGGPAGIERALDVCRKDDSPLARVLGAGIRRLGRPIELVEKALADAGEWETLQLRKRLRVLSVCASVSPLLGLTGTIFGMITAFQTVANSGEALGKAELLAEGIYEAMVTTAAGLLVAIPALICYHWLSSKIERLASGMDRAAVSLVERYAEPATGHAIAPPFSPSSNGEPAGVVGAEA